MKERSQLPTQEWLMREAVGQTPQVEWAVAGEDLSRFSSSSVSRAASEVLW